MAHGLRLINNLKPASLDGREYGIYCSAEFRKGRSAWELPRGGAPSEVLRDRALRKASRAKVEHPTASLRSSRTSLTCFGELQKATGPPAARPQNAVLKRWERSHSSPCVNDVLCPASSKREAVQAKILNAAAAAPTAVANGPAATSSDLFSPALSCPTFPVSKFHYHGSRLPKNAKPPAGDLVRELPEGFFPTAEKPAPVERFRYFSEPQVALSENYHADDPFADGLAAARMTWRVRRGGTLRSLQEAKAAVT